MLLATFTVPAGYSTIKAAVNAANAAYNANPSSGPNTVLVSPGTYTDSNITITTPLTLASTNGAGSTTINGGNASTSQDGIIEVVGNSGSVTIGGPGQGFTLEGAPVASDGDINLIYLAGNTNPVTIQGNTLDGLGTTPSGAPANSHPTSSNAFDTGILALGTSGSGSITVQSNTFQYMFQGILFQQTVGSGTIQGNTFQYLVPSVDNTQTPAYTYEPEGIFALTFGGAAYNVANLAISTNNFANFNGLAITVDGGYQGYAPAQFSAVSITGNTISSIGFAPDTYRAGVVLIDDPGTSGTDGSQGGVVNSSVDHNTLAAQTACASGSAGLWVLGPNNGLTVANNFLQNLDYGVIIDQQVAGEAYASGVAVNKNSFTGDTIGILNPSSNLIDASYNYWGTTVPIQVKALANGGVNVDYNPWLDIGTNTSTSTPGFHPNLSQVPVTDTVQLSGSDSVASGSTYTLTLTSGVGGTQQTQHIGTVSTYTVNWGDGTTSMVAATNPTTTATHTYTNTSQTIYTVSATLTNSASQTFQVANSISVTSTVVPGLLVTSFTPTTSGFHVRFNQPINTSTLELYANSTATSPPPPDVTLVGASTGPVNGSLKLDPDGKGFTFIATGSPLASDTYTVTLLGGTTAITEGSSGSSPNTPLNGTASASPSASGSNYTTTFTVSPSTPTLMLPDFSRGPGQPVDAAFPGQLYPTPGAGLPIQISNGSGISSVMLTLTYDPTLLTISAVNLASGLPAGTQVVTNSTVPGYLTICVTTPSGSTLSSSAQNLVILTASVPSSAPYDSKADLNLQVTSINGSTSTGSGDQALELVNFLGNASGFGYYSNQDVTLIRQYTTSVIANPGFSHFPLVDPTIIGDIENYGYITNQDVTVLRQYTTATSNLPPQIPAYTSYPSVAQTGPDPKLSLPQSLGGMPGETLTVPVQFQQTNDAAIGLQSFSLVVSFDPADFSVSSISPGELASGFQLTESVDGARGLIIITGSSSQALTLAPGALGDLVEIDLNVLAGAKSGTSYLELLGNSGASVTSLNDGGLTLVPAPINAWEYSIDGRVLIGGRQTESPFSPGRSPYTYTADTTMASVSTSTTSDVATDTTTTSASTPTTSDVATDTTTASASTPTMPDVAIDPVSSKVSPSTSMVHDLAIESFAAEPGTPSYLVSLMTGVIADDPTEGTTGPAAGSSHANGMAIVSGRPAFRHRALVRVIATTEPTL